MYKKASSGQQRAARKRRHVIIHYDGVGWCSDSQKPPKGENSGPCVEQRAPVQPRRRQRPLPADSRVPRLSALVISVTARRSATSLASAALTASMRTSLVFDLFEVRVEHEHVTRDGKS